MKLAFSPLSCPSCNVDELIRMARKYGYDGVELRTLENTINLWELEDFSPSMLPATCEKFRLAGLQVLVVGTSISFAKTDPGNKEKQLDLLKKFSLIARGLDCPYLRVFGGPIPEGQTYGEVLSRDIEGYREAISIAEYYGVKLLFETHDDFSTSTAMLPLLEGTGGKAGVIWDILHPYRFGESMETTCKHLIPYVCHVHIKDSAVYSKDGFDIALPGQGRVPIPLAVSLLKEAGYEGYLCFEWEKHWHPDIANADISLPHYVQYMREIL